MKTCRDHCQIFVHHSPQEGNLGVEFDTLVESLAADICVCCDDDLHFRLAFPWYSYSPTLKFRQLDISSDEEWNKGQNLFVSFPAADNQGRVWPYGCWRGGWRLAPSHCMLVYVVEGNSVSHTREVGGGSSVSLHCNPQLPESLQIPPHTTLQPIPSLKTVALKYFSIWNGQRLISFSIGKQRNNYRIKIKFS